MPSRHGEGKNLPLPLMEPQLNDNHTLQSTDKINVLSLYLSFPILPYSFVLN